MKNLFSFIFTSPLFLLSCQTQQSSKTDSKKFDPDKTYQLHLSPAAGSNYHYDIINEINVDLEVDDKEVNNQNKTEVGVNYKIGLDSVNNYVFSSVYDKIHITSRKNDTETELDAANGAFSLNPTEKMLGLLKDATINVTVTPLGDVINMSGYKEIGEKLIENFSEFDIAGKKAAREQWETQVGNGLIKKNFDQLFKFFPDSTIHLGDTWKLTSRQEGDLSYNITSSYKLKAINSEIAIIESTGKINTSRNDNKSSDLDEATVVNITGEQTTEIEIETKTGMVINGKVKTSFEGSVMALGREVPVKAKMSVKISGKRVY